MRHRLLALAGCRAGDIGAVSLAEWHALDALADGHRLRPHLHGRLTRGEIAADVPDPIAAGWRNAHRANAIAILVQRRALLQAVALLEAESITSVALKGSALAWSVWPAPAERVMRDIDVLVPAHRAVDAYGILRGAGWQAPDAAPALLERIASSETHLPPVFSPDGVMCELHARVWASPPLSGSPMPRSDDAGLLARAVFDPEQAIHVPAAEDMLAHLIVHCAASHLFNVGPPALADIAYWLDANTPDWAAFWARADADGFQRHAGLVLALVDTWFRPGLLETSGCPLTIEADILDKASHLLAQRPEARKDINAIAGLALDGAGGRLKQHHLDEAAMVRSPLARARELAGRGVSVAISLIDPATRRDGLAAADIARWMRGV
ncbi:nucleotidyltransferase domain-containing protein [Qipengyuania zhejiangensis]|uniref:nucleotidyltransferase domain-containing protein n=1 Tax=Qipengyuania zhejiangensis TaxID=3077782 RepID=UPI002D76BA6D|nr:nucleotidyltransferase family protein [Qipengyuania sp. Z2]